MSAAGGGSVFVSYRREGGGDAAGRLADRLVNRFGVERVFMDVDAIEPGMDYVEAITRAVGACDVLVVVIGPGWLTAAGALGRRLDDPDDWVRVEVRTALERGVRVIPVLVGGAAMPDRADLPDDLAGLVRRNALHIRHESFRADATQLVSVIERVLITPSPVLRGVHPSTAPDSTDGADTPARRGDQADVTRLITEAEGVAKSITNEQDRASALSRVAAVAAMTGPRRAERPAKSITNKQAKAWALAMIARAIISA